MAPDCAILGASSISMKGSWPYGVVGFSADQSGKAMRRSSKSTPPRWKATDLFRSGLDAEVGQLDFGRSLFLADGGADGGVRSDGDGGRHFQFLVLVRVFRLLVLLTSTSLSSVRKTDA